MRGSLLLCSGSSRSQRVLLWDRRAGARATSLLRSSGISAVPRGAIVGGRLRNGPWGCRCAHWFCPQCSTLPTGPLSCEWTTCAPLSGAATRAGTQTARIRRTAKVRAALDRISARACACRMWVALPVSAASATCRWSVCRYRRLMTASIRGRNVGADRCAMAAPDCVARVGSRR